MSELPQAERELLVRAERRLGWFILGLTPVGTVVAVWNWSAGVGVAFAFGGGLAYLNYRWIVSLVDSLVRAQQVHPTTRTYLKLFVPVVLLALLLYVIFSRSLLSLAGVIGGLLLLVAAVFLEAIYQVVLAVRKQEARR